MFSRDEKKIYSNYLLQLSEKSIWKSLVNDIARSLSGINRYFVTLSYFKTLFHGLVLYQKS